MTIDEAVQQYERDHARRIANLESIRTRTLAEMRKFAALREQVKAVWPELQDPVSCYGYEHCIVRVTQEQLPALRQAVGRLTKLYVTLYDGKKRLVNVWLTCEMFPEARFYYVRELSDDDSCKIVEQPRDPVLNLVCETGVKDAVQA